MRANLRSQDWRLYNEDSASGIKDSRQYCVNGTHILPSLAIHFFITDDPHSCECAHSKRPQYVRGGHIGYTPAFL